VTGLRRWLPVIIAVAWLTAMAGTIWSQLSLSNDISKFLVDSNDARLSWISRQLAESELPRTVILVVDTKNGDRQRALAAASALADALADEPEVAWAHHRWDPKLDEAFHELYFPRRFLFAAEDPATLDERLSDAGLERTAGDVAERMGPQMGGALGSSIDQQLARDPLLLYPAQLHRLEQLQLAPLDAEGHFITEDGRAVVLLTTVHSPFDFDHQRQLQAAITDRFAELDREAQAAGDDLTLIQSSVVRFALQAEAQIRGDIQRISTISIFGVVILFVLLFRSLRTLLLSMLPLVAGFLTATGMVLLIFGEVHVLTLVFGASLIGVCIDYPIHLFTHHAHYPSSDREEMIAGVRPGLLLGALTTMAGFVGMGWAAFPGIREISGFAAIGIVAALATTLWVLPSLLPATTAPARSQRLLMRRAERLVAWMSGSRRLLLALPLSALVVMAIGLPRLEYQDDVSVLVEREPEHVAEDAEVRSLVSRADGGRAIVVFGEDDEEALTRNAEVHRRLHEAVAAGELKKFQSLTNFLWPTSMQAANRKEFCSHEDLPKSLARAYVRKGLPGENAPFIEDLVDLCRGTPPELDWPTLTDSALGPAVAPLRLEYGRRTALVTNLSGVEDIEALRARMVGVPEVVVFDQRALMTELYGRHRGHTIQLVGLGLLAVMLILFARHRELRSTLAAFAPSILAAGMTLGLLCMFGPITLMHVVGLLLVLSMGVDYGVFLTETCGDQREVAATLSSLIACCISTVLSIGLLGLSSNPGLQALGVTTGIGVLLSLILAPTALVLLGAMNPDPSSTMSGLRQIR
jgi:predicted exporter